MFTFLLAELPELSLTAPAPLSLDEFDALVREAMIPEKYIRLLAAYPGEFLTKSDEKSPLYPVFERYLEFERFLRLRIARLRCAKLGIDDPLPDAEKFFVYANSAIEAANGIADPLEKEKLIDGLRWAAVDEIVPAGKLDFDALCAYKIKLVLLNMRRFRDRETGRAAFDALLERKVSMAN